MPMVAVLPCLTFSLCSALPAPSSTQPHPQETLRLIRTKEVEYPAYLSREAVDFMRSVLVREPTHR